MRKQQNIQDARSSYASPKVNKVHACALDNNDNNDKNMREEINVRAVDLKHTLALSPLP